MCKILLKSFTYRFVKGLDDLDQYNRDTIHDMYEGSDYEINTGELHIISLPLAQQEFFADEDLYEYIDNLNNWD